MDFLSKISGEKFDLKASSLTFTVILCVALISGVNREIKIAPDESKVGFIFSAGREFEFVLRYLDSRVETS